MIRFIGDVHQRYELYLPLLPKNGYSIQVGDLGFDYSYLDRVGLDPGHCKVLGGNHDSYAVGTPNYFKNKPYFLGDFGTHQFVGEPPVFYVRGGWSIDHASRREGIDWFPEEELSIPQLGSAIELYRRRLPEIVVSHEAPHDLVKYLTDPNFARRYGYEGVVKTRTSMALQQMFDSHQPKVWVFGHYHRPWDGVIGRTHFVCLDMLTMKGRTNGCTFDL